MLSRIRRKAWLVGGGLGNQLLHLFSFLLANLGLVG